MTAAAGDGPAAVICTPASGDLFPIGDTTVTCTATATAGNTATASFVVHVRGAAEQLEKLAAAASGVGPGLSLANKIAQAGAALSANDPAKATAILEAFMREVAAQSGRKITRHTATALLQAAAQIQAIIA